MNSIAKTPTTGRDPFAVEDLSMGFLLSATKFTIGQEVLAPYGRNGIMTKGTIVETSTDRKHSGYVGNVVDYRIEFDEFTRTWVPSSYVQAA